MLSCFLGKKKTHPLNLCAAHACCISFSKINIISENNPGSDEVCAVANCLKMEFLGDSVGLKAYHVFVDLLVAVVKTPFKVGLGSAVERECVLEVE